MTTNNQSINKTAEMTKMALMVAMNCISAYIIIPLPFSLSPIALQTLIVNLTGYVLNVQPAFMTGVLPFIPLDIVKCLGAAFLAGPIHRIFDNK